MAWKIGTVHCNKRAFSCKQGQNKKGNKRTHRCYWPPTVPLFLKKRRALKIHKNLVQIQSARLFPGLNFCCNALYAQSRLKTAQLFERGEFRKDRPWTRELASLPSVRMKELVQCTFLLLLHFMYYMREKKRKMFQTCLLCFTWERERWIPVDP